MKLFYSVVLCFFVGLFFVPTTVSFAQSHLKFQHLTVDNGLSNNIITCILQDRMGFMWIGTQDGLNRYDGKNIRIFRNLPTDSTSLTDNWIGKIAEDSEGNLWISTQNALHSYNPLSGKFKRYHRNLKDSSSYQGYWTEQLITILGKKEIWLQGDINSDKDRIRYQRYNPKTDKFDNYSCYLSEAQQKGTIPKSLFEYQGEFYGGGGAFRFDRKQNKFMPIHQNQTLPIILDRGAFTLDNKGNIWLVGINGTTVYNLTEQKYTQIWGEDRSIKGERDFRVRATAYDAFFSPTTHTIWVAAFGGLVQINPQTGETTRYLSNQYDNYSLKAKSNHTVYEDNNHNLWVGTDGGGVSYVSLRPKFYHEYPRFSKKQATLSLPNVRSFAEDEEKNIWIATADGLNYWDKKKYIIYIQDSITLKKKGTANYFTSLVFNKNDQKLYLGSWGAGLHTFDIGQKKFEYLSLENSNTPNIKERITNCGWGFLNQVALDKDGNAWIVDWGCGYGLNKYDKVSKSFISYSDTSLMPQNKVELLITFLSLPNEKILAGTNAKGLFVFDKQAGRYQNRTFSYNINDKTSLSADEITDIYQSKAGQIWVGTSNGLNLMQADSSFVRFTKADGLPSDYISGISEDSKGNLWISTKAGISQMKMQSKQFTNFNISDGLQGNDFNERSVFKSSTGELFFGGSNGFNYFHPDSVEVRKNTLAPKVVFTDFKVFDKNLETDTSIVSKKYIALNHDENDLNVNFIALDMSAPAKNQYQYRLVLLDNAWFNIGNNDKLETKAWISLGNNTSLTLPRIGYGKYALQIMGSNNDGVWSENEKMAMLYIDIAPPFYFTKWFLILMLLVAICSIWWFYRRRSQALRQKNEELESQVKDRTKRIEEQKEEIKVQKEEIEVQNEDLSSANKELLELRRVQQHRTINDFKGLFGNLKDDNGQVLPQYQDVAGKLLAIATTQERLAKSTKADDYISITEEIPAFMQNVKEVMGAKKLNIQTDIGKFELRLNKSNALLYLIDELARNAIKHAFAATAQPEVSLFLHQENGALRLIFKDNGSGLPEGKKPRVIHDLVANLNGTVKISNENGTVYDMVLRANLKG